MDLNMNIRVCCDDNHSLYPIQNKKNGVYKGQSFWKSEKCLTVFSNKYIDNIVGYDDDIVIVPCYGVKDLHFSNQKFDQFLMKDSISSPIGCNCFIPYCYYQFYFLNRYGRYHSSIIINIFFINKILSVNLFNIMIPIEINQYIIDMYLDLLEYSWNKEKPILEKTSNFKYLNSFIIHHCVYDDCHEIFVVDQGTRCIECRDIFCKKCSLNLKNGKCFDCREE